MVDCNWLCDTEESKGAHGGMRNGRLRSVHKSSESCVRGVSVIFTTELFLVGGVFIKTQHPLIFMILAQGKGDYANFKTFLQNSPGGFSNMMQITPTLKSCKTGNSLNLGLVRREFVSLPAAKHCF